jgi:hypothetical protein
VVLSSGQFYLLQQYVSREFYCRNSGVRAFENVERFCNFPSEGAMKFLCLHGRGTNSDIFETQLGMAFLPKMY